MISTSCTQIIVAICLATASSAHGEEREAKQFWPNTPQSSPLIYQTLPQHHQYPIHYPVGFGFGGVQRIRTKVTGTLKSKTVTPAIQKFRLHSQKNKPATSTYNNNNFETLFWFLDKVSFRSLLRRSRALVTKLIYFCLFIFQSS